MAHFFNNLWPVLFLMLRRKNKNKNNKASMQHELESMRSYKRDYYEANRERLRLQEENGRLESLLHDHNAVSCDDCIFNVKRVCAHGQADAYDRCDKKKCTRYARPLKSISKCSHNNTVHLNETASKASGYKYICLDCGTLITEDDQEE